MTFILDQNNSIANHFLAELRDAQIQQDSMRFRKNMERLGEVFAYEISKTMGYKEKAVETSLGTARVRVMNELPVLATILRAGLPLHRGLLNYFDRADSAFISAYRKTTKGHQFIIKIEYISAPSLDGKILVIADPMIATGESMVLCCKELLARYEIKELHLVGVIASKLGLDHIEANLPNAKLWIGSLDEELTTKSYIVPGLGDAGDLSFGIKE
ncbi:MAG: uracil phosphoribosyltransferase [Bacteroidetes bacterium]|nr:uracil phosphoribosyltransferase [Bacteroidota bacterium]